jgi:hypothetical protein
VIGASALDKHKKRFVLDVGARFVGIPRYDLDYTVVSSPLAKDMVNSPFLNYEGALRSVPKPGTAVLAGVHEPFFKRTVGKYCSHQNTPYRLQPAPQPAVLQHGKVIWFAHSIGAMYYLHGARLHRQLFLNALARVYTKPVLETSLLSAGRAVVTHQAEHRRYVVHLLYASPQQRGRCTVIEDLPILVDVPVKLRVPERILRVELPLHKQLLPMKRTVGQMGVIVPRVQCHEVVVFSY